MHVGIVGGGLAGLTAAYDLSKSGHRVTVFEAAPQPGGLVGTFSVGGERLEQFYHHIFMSDTQVVRLIEELGLAGRLVWKDSKVGFFRDGNVYDFVTPMDLLRFKPLPPVDRLRLGLAGVQLRRLANWESLEPVTSKEWIVRHVGRKAYDVVWGPLLRGKFGTRADEVGMVWFWGKIFFRFSSRRGLRQREQLGYLMGSFGLLIDELVGSITRSGSDVRLGAPVTRINIENGRATGVVTTEAGEEKLTACDAVIATIDPRIFRPMVPGLDGDYLARLNRIDYQAVVCLNLVLNRSLSRIYWMNISDADMPFLAAIEHTNFIDRSHYQGKHILYLSKYLAGDDPLYRMSTSEMLETFTPHLKKINPDFDASWVEDSYLFKASAAQPIISTHYSQRIPPLATPIRGLYLANMSQIYPQDRGQNYAIELGYKVSSAVKSEA